MKISAMLDRNNKFEEQKRYLQRKEAKDTYKKNASYTQADKNPMLAILENLLSGKTEKELYENQEPTLNESDESKSMDSTIELTDLPLYNLPTMREKGVENTALSEQLQTQVEMASANEDEFDSNFDRNLEFNIPNRILLNLNTFNFNRLDIKKNIDTALFDKNYKKAVSTYNQQMEIARQGYVTKPTMYSISA